MAGTVVVLFTFGPKAFALAAGIVLAVFLIEKLAHLYFTHKYNQNVALLNNMATL
jgi:hypothetical protein